MEVGAWGKFENCKKLNVVLFNINHKNAKDSEPVVSAHPVVQELAL